jgi:hypothetical protein
MPEQVWSTATNNASYQARLQAITNQMAVLTLDLARLPRGCRRSSHIPGLYPNPEGHLVAAQAIEAFIRPVVVQGMFKHSMANSPRPIRTTPPGA